MSLVPQAGGPGSSVIPSLQPPHRWYFCSRSEPPNLLSQHPKGPTFLQTPAQEPLSPSPAFSIIPCGQGVPSATRASRPQGLQIWDARGKLRMAQAVFEPVHFQP